jgi:hypothetical protein
VGGINVERAFVDTCTEKRTGPAPVHVQRGGNLTTRLLGRAGASQRDFADEAGGGNELQIELSRLSCGDGSVVAT